MTTTTSTLSADAGAYVREMQRIDASLQKNLVSLERLARANNQLAREGVQSTERQAAGWDRLVIAGGKAAATYALIRTGISVVNRELQQLVDLQQKLAAQSTTEAAALERLYANVGDPAEAKRLANTARAMAARRGVPIAAAMDTLSQAVSAKGEAPVSAAVGAAEVALRAMPNNLTEAASLAGSVLEARLVTGSTDAAQNYAVLAALQKVSRPVSMASTSAYLVPGASAAQRSFAGNQFDWLAIAAAMTGYGGDRSGELTKTAVMNLSHRMRDFFAEPAEVAALAGGIGGLGMGEAFAAAGGLGGLEYFWKNPAAARRFMDDAKFGARSLPGVAELLFNENSRRNVLENRAAMRAARPELGGQLLAELESEGASQASRSGRAAASAAEQRLSATAPQHRRLAAIRGQMRDLLSSLGAGGTEIAAWEKAFELQPGGQIGRADWMERALRRWADEPREQVLVADVLAELRSIKEAIVRANRAAGVNGNQGEQGP